MNRTTALSAAATEIAVHGDALSDPAFTDRGADVTYEVPADAAAAPFEISAELWYQPVSYRWATNLGSYASAEPQRFHTMFKSVSAASAMKLAETHATVP